MMAQETDHPKQKWKRASKPKSRTGCLACRQRRVKCDESRPACLRCSKAGYECDFMIVTATPRRPSAATLLPKPPSSHALPLSRLRHSGRVSIDLEIEKRYFDHFQRKTTSGFQVVMDWSIWNHLLLQLCHQESFVRDSVVAIGALIRSLEVGSSSKEVLAREGGPSRMAAMHRQYAFLKYTEAVKTMQSFRNPETRQLLVACLLVFCFETLLNNCNAALPQIVTGHLMLQDWLSKHHRSILIDSGQSSPAPETVDDELVNAYEHVDLQISTIYDVRPIEMHRTIINQVKGVIQQMPSTFNTLIDAGRYLTVVMKQSHHFLATAWQSTQPGMLVADFATIPPGSLPIISGSNSSSTPYIVPEYLHTEQRPYAEDVLYWSHAFEPLFRQVQQLEKPGSKNYVTSAMLKMQAIATRIMVAGVLITEELSYDIFLPQFREMLVLINIIVDAYRSASDQEVLGTAGFSLGLGISPPLLLLVTRCRDRTIRRKGIEILGRWHQEACWDPLIIAEMGKFIVDVEEAGVPEGIIPESSRATIARVCQVPSDGKETREALIQICQRRGGLDGGPVWKEKMVYYGGRLRPDWGLGGTHDAYKLDGSYTKLKVQAGA